MRINKEEALFLLIDIQERLYPVMHNREELLQKSRILLQGMDVLGVPGIVTEQYPRGLGSTLEELKELLPAGDTIEKLSFSCCGEPSFFLELERSGRKRILVFGIEAHVCVLQTVTDLTEAGFTPVVVSDCISSRKEEDKLIALDRMKAEGALLTTVESILFELAGVAGTEEFKAISRLVK